MHLHNYLCSGFSQTNILHSLFAANMLRQTRSALISTAGIKLLVRLIYFILKQKPENEMTLLSEKQNKMNPLKISFAVPVLGINSQQRNCGRLLHSFIPTSSVLAFLPFMDIWDQT